jgi:hypothetical protein
MENQEFYKVDEVDINPQQLQDLLNKRAEEGYLLDRIEVPFPDESKWTVITSQAATFNPLDLLGGIPDGDEIVIPQNPGFTM